MTEFERLLGLHRGAVERFVRFKIASAFDADDVLQETYIAASEGFATLGDRESFRAWIVAIARNKVRDYYRRRSRSLELPLEEVGESALVASRYGLRERTLVRETLAELSDRDRAILYDHFFLELKQDEIAKKRGVPLGTVKSRLHTAKKNFRKKYPYPPKPKGELFMGKLPEYLPGYSIIPNNNPPFEVVWEELMGWFIVPKLGEKLSWAMYDLPERKRTELDEMEVVGRAEVHGIEGVEIVAHTVDPMDCNSEGGQAEVDRRFVAQLTDSHCRILAESHVRDGVKRYFTFLDGDDFLENWGFGENNCGNETRISPKGDIVRDGDAVTTKDKRFLLDVVGRYTVKIDGREFDTICVMDVSTYNDGGATEQFIDKNGRTVLWRRFNSDDWHIEHYGKRWSELLPENERIHINGETYVHWYDCITDYIF